MAVVVAAAMLSGAVAVIESQGKGCSHVEDFTGAGNPGRLGAPGVWRLRTEENPEQRWTQVAPGDGLARLSVPASAVNDDGGFQSLQWGPIGPYGSIEARMRGAALPGYAAFLFTYVEPGDGTFDEIDIEILADDSSNGRSIGHGVATDVRLNSWNRADADAPPDPDASVFTSIVGEQGEARSIYDDGEFHTFTIDWYPDLIEFHVDGVLQGRIDSDSAIPDRPVDVIVGFRDLEFGGLNLDESGRPVWSGTSSLEIDYLQVCDNGVVGNG